MQPLGPDMNLKAVARGAVRPIVRPIWRRAWARLETRLRPIEVRLAAIEARLQPIEVSLQPIEVRLAAIEARPQPIGPVEAQPQALEAAWRTHVPAFLNAVGTVGAFGHKLVQVRTDTDKLREDFMQIRGSEEKLREDFVQVRTDTEKLREDFVQVRAGEEKVPREIKELWERIEFVRREILFELAHGNRARTGAERGARLEPRVLAEDKLRQARAADDIRLNLGCGHIALPGYLNVDMRELPGVDIVAEVDHLPFEPGSVSEVFSAHLVEHFPQEAMRRRLLPYWWSLLRPGGSFRAVTPDAATMIAAAGQGGCPFEDFREVVFGAQDYEGDYHYNLFTPDSMRALLEEARFLDIRVPVSGRRNGKCFEFEISGVRP
jgi:hypothetical protein